MAAYWLAARGCEVKALCGGTGGRGILDSPLAPVQYQACPGGSRAFLTGVAREMLQVRFRTDTVYYLQGHEVTLPALFMLAGLPSRRIIYHTQDFLEPGRYPHWEFCERLVARRAGCVISNEPNRARFMQSYYRLRKPPLVVPTLLPEAWPIPERDEGLRRSILARADRQDGPDLRLVMNQGAFSRARCGQELIQSFHLLPPHYILILTNTDQPAYARLLGNPALQMLHRQRRFIALGHLGFEDLLRHTACCDLGVMLYPNEGIGGYYQAPGRLTHYMGCGLPMVASNFPGLELAFLKHSLGAVCDPASPEAIALAIRQVGEESDARCEERRVRLRVLARTVFAYDRQAWQIEEAVRQASL